MKKKNSLLNRVNAATYDKTNIYKVIVTVGKGMKEVKKTLNPGD